MENCIYYFSGTGNSLSVARKLKEKLGGDTEVRAMTWYLNQDEILIEAEKTLGLVFPVYGSDAPWPVKEFIEKAKLKNNPYVYMIGTCNARGSHFMDQVNALLLQSGIHTSYACTMNMPGNCLGSSPDENAERLELEDPTVDRIAKNIKRGFISSLESHDVPVSSAEAKNRFNAVGFNKKYVYQDSCIKCGICAKACPMGNITMSEEGPVFGDNCACCFACFHLCPKEAVYFESAHFNRDSDRRPSYHHPDITWKDIAEQNKKIAP